MMGLEQNSTEGRKVRGFPQHREGVGTAVVGKGLDPFISAYSEFWLVFIAVTK